MEAVIRKELRPPGAGRAGLFMAAFCRRGWRHRVLREEFTTCRHKNVLEIQPSTVANGHVDRWQRIPHNSQKSFGCSRCQLIRERTPVLDALTIHGRDIPHQLASKSPTTFANIANCQQTLIITRFSFSLSADSNVQSCIVSLERALSSQRVHFR